MREMSPGVRLAGSDTGVGSKFRQAKSQEGDVSEKLRWEGWLHKASAEIRVTPRHTPHAKYEGRYLAPQLKSTQWHDLKLEPLLARYSGYPAGQSDSMDPDRAAVAGGSSCGCAAANGHDANMLRQMVLYLTHHQHGQLSQPQP